MTTAPGAAAPIHKPPRAPGMPWFAAILLGIAVLLTIDLLVQAFLVPPEPGYSGLGAFLLMLAAGCLLWIVLAMLLGWCAWTRRFDWLQGGTAAGRFGLVLLGHLVLGGLCFYALLAVADHSVLNGWSPRVRTVLHAVAQIGCTLPALAIIAGVIATARPGSARRPLGPMLALAAGALAAVTIAGTMVAQDAAEQQARDTRAETTAIARSAGLRQRYARLTDADPLLRWDEFVHGTGPDGLATEALHRLSIRPTLEADLIDALGCDCRNVNWTGELLWLVAAIPFRAGPDLAAPAATAIGVLADNVRSSVDKAFREQRDIHVDLYLARDLGTARAVALKLARDAGSDLRPALRDMRGAVLDTYPRSQAARRYPAEVDGTVQEITAILGRP